MKEKFLSWISQINRKMITILLSILVVGIVLLKTCGKKNNIQDATGYRTMTIAAQPATTELYFKSTIEPKSILTVTNPVEGKIEKIAFEFSQPVKKGQLLFVISSTKFKTDFQTALTDYLKAKRDYATQETNMVASEDLWKSQLISRQDYNKDKQAKADAYVNYNQRRQQLGTLIKTVHGNIHAEAVKGLLSLNIDDTEAVSEVLQADIREIDVFSPAGGVTLLPTDSGDSEKKTGTKLVSGNAVKTDQALVSIGDMSGVLVRANIQEINIHDIKPGQKATVTGPAFPNITLEGMVEKVDTQATRQNSGGLPQFPITILVPKLTPEQSQKIHVGMTANIKILITQPARIIVPLAAVSRKNNKAIVQIIDSKTKLPKDVSVVTGKTAQDTVIIEQGLKIGDTVVIPNQTPAN